MRTTCRKNRAICTYTGSILNGHRLEQAQSFADQAITISWEIAPTSSRDRTIDRLEADKRATSKVEII